MCSGNAPKHTISEPGADHSANAPRSARTDQEGLASPTGAGSPTQVCVSASENKCERTDSVSVPQSMDVLLLSATPHAGEGNGVTGGFRKLEAVLAWMGLYGVSPAVRGVTNLSTVLHCEDTLLANQ